MESVDKISETTKGMKTKKKIYEVAVKMFEENGVDKTSVNEIVKKAGISKGDFYIHYKSKFSLIEEYTQNLDADYEEIFNKIPENTSASDMIYLVTRKIAQVQINDIGYNIIKNCYTAMLSGKIDSSIVLNYSRPLPEIYKTLIQKGIHEGKFKSTTDVDSFTKHLMISIQGMIFNWCVCSCSFDLEKELLNHVELLLKGIE